MALTKDGAFLNFFWELASDDQGSRTAASKGLLDFVRKNTSETDYALLRLVKGLASSRESARQGFSTCLCGFLLLPGVTVTKALEYLDEHSKLTGSVKGAEERDFLFAKLFCYLCIIRSGVTKADQTLTMNLLDRLIELHEKKGWIREVVSEAILLFCASLTEPVIIQCTIRKLKALLTTPLNEMAAWQIMLLTGLQQFNVDNTIVGQNCSINNIWQKEWLNLMPSFPNFCLQQLSTITDTLLASTNGYPKIHRVWDYIISYIFPMDVDRELPSIRVSSISSKQESSLLALTAFIDSQLLPASNEKRSVAWHLTTLLVQRCPAEFIPVALSQACVLSLKSARMNKKNTLNHLAGTVLNQLVIAVGSDVSCKLALISAVMQYGGVNFDSLTTTKTVEPLLSGLSYEAVTSHVNLLCGIVAAATIGKNHCNEDGSVVMDTNDHTTSAAALSALEALAAITKNARIGSNRGLICTTVVTVLTRISCFGEGCGDYSTVTAQIASSSATEKKNKKANKKSKNEETPVLVDYCTVLGAALAAQKHDKAMLLPLPAESIEAVKIIERAALSDRSSPSLPASLIDLAGQKLLTILSDIGSCTIAQLNTSTSATTTATTTASNEPDSITTTTTTTTTEVPASSSSPTIQQLAWSALNCMHSSGLPVLMDDTQVISLDDTSKISHIKEEEEEDSENTRVILGSTILTDSFSVVADCMNATTSALNDSKEETSSKRLSLMQKLHDSMHSLLINTVFHTLIVKDSTSAEYVQSIVSILPAMLHLGDNDDDEDGDSNGKKKKSVEENSSSDDSDSVGSDESIEGDKDSNLLMELLDISMDLLAMNSSSSDAQQHQQQQQQQQSSTRSIRDAVKKVWNIVCTIQGPRLSVDVIDCVVAAVIGEQVDREGEEEEQEEEEEMDEEKEEEEQENKTEEADANGKDNRKDEDNNNKKKKKNKKNKAKKSEDEEEDEEDILISQEEAFDLLVEGMDEGAHDGDDDDNEMINNNNNSDEEEEDADNNVENSATALDDALANMVRLRQQSRKSGMLRAHRQQLLVRSRSLDILEIIIQKIDRGVLLFPLFQPLLQCLISSYSSSLTQSVAEGVAYCNRLQAVLEQKLSKKKISLPASEECSPEEVYEEYLPVNNLLIKMLTAAQPALRHVGQACYMSVARTVYSSGSSPAQQLLITSMQQLFEQYTTKRNTRISLKFMDDVLLNRLTDISVPVLWTQLNEKIIGMKHCFLRTELTRLLTAVIKKYNGTGAAAQNVMRCNMPLSVTALTTQLQATMLPSEATSTTNASSLPSSTKLKPLLSSTKELTEFLKKSIIGTAAGSGKNSTNSTSNAPKTSAGTVVYNDYVELHASVNSLDDSLKCVLKALTKEDCSTAIQNSMTSIVNSLKQILTHTQAVLPAVATAAAEAAASFSKASAEVATPSKKQKLKGDKKKSVGTNEDVAVVVAVTPAKSAVKKALLLESAEKEVKGTEKKKDKKRKLLD